MDHSNELTLGAVLQAAREAHGLSQRQLARLLDVAFSQVSRWERNEAVPASHSLVALAQQLELSASRLFELAGVPVPEDRASLPAMLRAEYQLPPKAIADIQRYITKIAKEYRDNEA
jgi:transcriptional regulator with XRE-family HTH domain